MSLFDFTFALSAVVLGLALTHLAANTHKLLLAGDRVLWATEPILLATIVFFVIVGVWLEQWSARSVETVMVAQIFVQTLKFLALYFAAASCLPEPPPEGVSTDLYAYYDRTRRLSFGALLVSLLLFRFDQFAFYDLPDGWTIWDSLQMALYPVLWLLLLFIRRRWLNKLILVGALLHYGWMLLSSQLST